MRAMLRPRWTLLDVAPDRVHDLARVASCSVIVARLLVQRGIEDPAEAARFLDPRLSDLEPPARMAGMGAAVERILEADALGEKITIWGDYDVDGVTSASLLLLFFRDVGISADFFVPDRFIDGYGLSAPRIGELAAQGTRLLITVDCGVTAQAEIALAGSLGMDVVVVDHHHPPRELPACILVNPLQPGCGYSYKKMAAVGLTFHLLVALRAALRERGRFAERPEPDLRDLLDLVAIGTVADVVPLTGTNRILTWHGLRRVAQSRHPGVKALCRVSGIDGPVGAGQVGFQLGPRINAAGRLSSATKGVELLTSRSLEAAMGIAEEVDRENRERRAIEQTMLEEALAQATRLGDPAGRRALVLSSPTWHAGVVGIVASKVVERFHRPTFVIAVDGDVGKGSGRSVEGFHLVEGLDQVASDLVGYGGHAHAAGVTVAADRIPRFAERLDAVARERLSEAQLTPTLRLDAEVPLGAVTWDLVADLERLAPFGPGNPRPTFLGRAVRVQDVRVVGSGHLKMTVEQGGTSCDCIGFRLADRAPRPGDRVDLAFRPQIDTFNGRQRLQLDLRDLRPA